jgi:hypothetical protein
MFNIADFSSNLNKHGTIQTNKFIVRIPPPMIFGPSNIDPIIEYRASAVKVPGLSFDFQNNFRYGIGPQQKFPTNMHITDVDVTFIDTARSDIWRRFTKWMNGIFDITGTSGGSQPSYVAEYKAYYETDIRIIIYDNDGYISNIVVLKEAYPVSLSDVSLSWSDNNRLYQFNVRFAFREWYYDGYNASTFRSGAILGPGLTSQVVPQRSESPRGTFREETYGPPVPQINPNRSSGGPLLTPGQNQGLRTEQANRNRAGGYYTPEQEAEYQRMMRE